MKFKNCWFIILLTFIVVVRQCANGNGNSKDEENEENKLENKKSESDENVNTANIQKEENVVQVETAALLELPNSSEREPTTNDENVANSKTTMKELKEALKYLDEDDIDEIVPDEIKGTKERFRKYEEIKKELEGLNLFPKSDAEVIKELVEEYKSAKGTEDILLILEDFDYLVHQYDNAQEFINLNGFQEIIYKNLNSSEPEIRGAVLKLLGSAVQHNAKVQIHALETDAINIVLKVLAIDPDYSVRNRAVFALSGLLRHFPIAQLKFVERAGLSVFSKLFDKPQDIKIQLKVVTLINDLLLEQRDALNDTSSIDYKEKVKQYKLVNLKQRLKDGNWCENLENLLKNVIIVDERDHDAIERCLDLMRSVSDICTTQFSGNTLLILHKLKNMYEELILAEGKIEKNDDFDAEYFIDMRNLCNEIIETIKAKLIKTEL